MDSFGFVILAALTSVFLHVYLSVKVSLARRKYNVPLPDQYTTDKDKLHFNCYQRAYINMTEGYPVFLVLLFLGGDIFPIVSAGAGFLWVFGRVLYAWGYYTGDPAKRENGAPFYLCGLLILLVCTIANILNRLNVINI